MRNLLLPEWFNPWGWTAIAIVAAIILIVIIVLVVRSIKKSEAQDDGDEEYAEEEEEVTADEDEEAAPLAAAETAEPVSATAKPVKEEKKVKESEKPAKEEKKAAESEKSAKEEKSASAVKVYHISKRKEDGKWQVKAAKGAKALKLFKTQAEAIEYAKEVAGNQEAKIVIHKVDGSFRQLTYK